MIRFEKHLIPALLVGVLVFCFFVVPSYGLMWNNETDEAYQKKDSTASTREKDEVPQVLTEDVSSGMGEMIVDGASNFLGSYSDYLLFLNKIELASIGTTDYRELGSFLDSAIEKLQRSRDMYITLIWEAEKTPYNYDMIRKLLEFNYRGFKMEHNLNPVVFDEVASFLGTGNVRGAYYRTYYRVEYLLQQLYFMKHTVDYGITPEVGQLWKLNRDYSNLLFFGQYMTMVFNRLMGRF